MDIEELYRELDRAYSDENLNLITGKLILLYKNRNFDKIREIAGRVLRTVELGDEKESRIFSRLMKLYHPDKGSFLRDRIRQYYHSQDIDSLTKFAHVLHISDIDRIQVNPPEEDIDYNPEYGRDIDPLDDLYYNETMGFQDPDDPFARFYDVFYQERNIYYALKIRGYGMNGIPFSLSYMNYFEELDFARNGIQSLDGIEYCSNTRYLDLSGNEISDISLLDSVNDIEELYLENNLIGSVEGLSNLSRLRILDISGNFISDVSPLTELLNLEFINLTGNPVPAYQIENLRQRKILVLFS